MKHHKKPPQTSKNHPKYPKNHREDPKSRATLFIANLFEILALLETSRRFHGMESAARNRLCTEAVAPGRKIQTDSLKRSLFTSSIYFCYESRKNSRIRGKSHSLPSKLTDSKLLTLFWTFYLYLGTFMDIRLLGIFFTCLTFVDIS